MSKSSNKLTWQLSSWLNYLSKLIVNRGQPSLEYIKQAVLALNLDKVSCPVITVTGTNGKGSVCAMLEQIYLSQGYNVGLYSSPHLFKFNERIKVNHQIISDDSICQALCLIDEYITKFNLSYFEVVLLIGLWYFSQQNLGLIILEVGIGGEFDATNVIDSNLAIITTVAIDHIHLLGDNRELIGRAKAGILREDQLVVCGDLNPPISLLNQVAKLNCKLSLLGKDYNFSETSDHWTFKNNVERLDNLSLPKLLTVNAAIALQASLVFRQSLPININQTLFSIINTWLLGRLSLFSYANCTLLIDVAHNIQSVKKLAEFILKNKFNRVLAIFSMLSDKDIKNVIDLMKNMVNDWFIAEINDKRALKLEKLVEAFTAKSMSNFTTHSDLKSAYSVAKENCQRDDCLLVFGSFYNVSEIFSGENLWENS